MVAVTISSSKSLLCIIIGLPSASCNKACVTKQKYEEDMSTAIPISVISATYDVFAGNLVTITVSNVFPSVCLKT